MKKIFDESLQEAVNEEFGKINNVVERCPTPLRQGNVYSEFILKDIYLAFPVQVDGLTQNVLNFEIWNQTEIKEYYIMERLDEASLMCYLRYNK